MSPVYDAIYGGGAEPDPYAGFDEDFGGGLDPYDSDSGAVEFGQVEPQVVFGPQVIIVLMTMFSSDGSQVQIHELDPS